MTICGHNIIRNICTLCGERRHSNASFRTKKMVHRRTILAKESLRDCNEGNEMLRGRTEFLDVPGVSMVVEKQF